VLSWQDLVPAVVAGLGGILGLQFVDAVLIGRDWPGWQGWRDWFRRD
jgi:hypothetical protein